MGVSSAEMGKLRAPAAVQGEVGAGKFSDGLWECFYPWNSCFWRIGDSPFCTTWPCNTFKTVVFSSHARGISAKEIFLPRRVSRLRGWAAGRGCGWGHHSLFAWLEGSEPRASCLCTWQTLRKLTDSAHFLRSSLPL